MKKILAIAVLFQAALFTATDYDPNEAQKELIKRKNPALLEHMPAVKDILTNGAMQHSLQIQFADMRFHPCPVSDRPFFYRITIPSSRCFYAVFSNHLSPVEFVMQRRTLEKFVDKCSHVVAEITDEIGQTLSKAELERDGLLMNGKTRQQFLDAEQNYIKSHYSQFPDEMHKWRLAMQAKWLDGWYSQLPESSRQELENDNDLLVKEYFLPQLHPALIIGEISSKQLAKRFEDQARASGMDNFIKQLFRKKGKSVVGLENERDRFEAGGRKERVEQVKDFMNPSGCTPIQFLQYHVNEIKTYGENTDFSLDHADCETIKKSAELAIFDYFHGNISIIQPSESNMKRTENWKPKIFEISSINSKPWMLLVGLDHHAELLQQFQEQNWIVERFSNIKGDFQ